MTSPRTKALEAYIEASVQQLLEGEESVGNDSLLFLGSWHDTYPAALVVDPNLTAQDVRVYLFLKQHALQQTRGPALFPSYDVICARLRIARATLSQSLTRLRITRWMSLCRRVRDSSGRYRGNVQALHDEPVALVDAVQLDPNYMRLLEDCARASDRGTREAARAALGAIEEDVAAGEDVMQRPNPMERRLESARCVSQGKGRFFGLRVGSRATRPVQNLNLAGSNSELAKPGAHSELGPQVIDLKASSNSELGTPCSSSCINKNNNYYRRNRKPPGAKESATSDAKPTDKGRSELRFPAGVSDNERRLIRLSLARKVSPEHWQPVLDALAARLEDVRHGAPPLRKGPVAYTHGLCKRVLQGEFSPVEARDTTRSAATAITARTKRLSALHGEIRGLEGLMDRAGDPTGALRRQVQTLRERLATEEADR